MTKLTSSFPDFNVNASELAPVLGVSERRLRQLVNEGRISAPAQDGHWPAGAVLRELFRHYRLRQSTGLLNAARLRRLTAQGRLAELEVAALERKLIPLARAEFLWSRACIGLRQVILASDVPHQTKEELTRHLREIPLEDYFPQSPDQADDAHVD